MTALRDPEDCAAWQADPEAWWMRAAAVLDWDRTPERALLGAFGR